MNRLEQNRTYNATNPAQGDYKRVLCICSAGLLRSPSTAIVLSQEPFNFNTRAAGLVQEYALILVDPVLLHWADELVCMTAEQKSELEKKHGVKKPIICLDIEDSYEYRNPELMKLIAERYTERTKK